MMPSKHQPDFSYLRHVPLRRVHLFTLIQIMCLSVLWVLKSTFLAIVFPVMVCDESDFHFLLRFRVVVLLVKEDRRLSLDSLHEDLMCSLESQIVHYNFMAEHIKSRL